MGLVLSRMGAIFLTLIGINLYYELLALHVANGISQLKSHGVPVAVVFIAGLIVIVVGTVMAFMTFMSRRTIVVLVSSIAVVVALSPFMGMIAQEIALKGAK